jgi:hypothetical protein
LQNVANNLPDAFTDYECVMKYWNPAVNAPERVKILKKTTQPPSTKKRGRTETTKKDNTSEKRPRKEKTKAHRMTKNVNRHVVE